MEGAIGRSPFTVYRSPFAVRGSRFGGVQSSGFRVAPDPQSAIHNSSTAFLSGLCERITGGDARFTLRPKVAVATNTDR
jgi:hypothetical protein